MGRNHIHIFLIDRHSENKLPLLQPCHDNLTLNNVMSGEVFRLTFFN